MKCIDKVSKCAIFYLMPGNRAPLKIWRKKMGKIGKTFVVLSIIWLIIMFAIAKDASYLFDWTGFVVGGFLPLVIGWGIYWVIKKK